MGDLARFNDLPGVRKRTYFPINPGDTLNIPTQDQLARMPAFEAPVMHQKRKQQEREKLANTVAAGLVVAACGVYAYQQLTGSDVLSKSSSGPGAVAANKTINGGEHQKHAAAPSGSRIPRGTGTGTGYGYGGAGFSNGGN